MAKTVAQLIAEFKVDDKALPQEFVAALNAEVADAHTQLQTATQYKTQGEQAREAAKQEKARIDAAIAAMGDSSLDNTKLKAQNKAFRAMVESLKADGLDLDLPADLMTEPKGGDPEPKAGAMPKEFKDALGTMGQAIAAADVAARYAGIYGKPMPMDMQTLVSTAARAGKTVQAYADEQFGLSGELKKRSEAEEQDRIKKYKTEAVEEYKKANPVTNENPFQRAGIDSRFSSMPKIRRDDHNGTKDFAGLSDHEKLRRAKDNAQKMLATQLQEQ
jgi:hypothetical protein